jgi:tetratricopeptide (TPR) repeat protein
VERDSARELAGVCAHLKEGQFAEAVGALERVIERDVEYPGAASALKCASFWMERRTAERAAADGFEHGEQLLGQWRLFLAFVERLQDAPEMCVFAIKQYVFSSALASYLSAQTDSVDDPDVLLQIGRCSKGMGNYERAIESLERANIARREDPRILAELADCYSLVSESRAAKVFFREAFFIDAQSIDIATLESPLIQRLASKLRGMGFAGPALNEWIPVYGAIWGILSVRRELKPLELGKLKQAIYQLSKELREPGAPREILVPRLANRYIWLIEHELGAGEPRERIDEVLEKIRELDPRVHRDYVR